MFKSLETSPSVNSEALCQVYEVHLCLAVEQTASYQQYKIGDGLVKHLHHHYEGSRKDERRCSENQRSEVASSLKSLVDGSVHVNLRTSLGLLVDVAALRRRSSADAFIHIDLNSPMTVVRSLQQDDASQAAALVEGPVALRRRLLAA